MAYTTAEARIQMLDDLAHAIDEIGVALGALGEAYELLDEQNGDRMEEQLFRPVQVTYGRAKRTYSGFAERHGLPAREFEPSAAGRAGQSAREALDGAIEAIEEADHLLVEIQDSMMPVEVGDPELRGALADVRSAIGGFPNTARDVVCRIGR